MTESFQTYRRLAPVQPALGRAARRGVTLIEAVLYIAVALGLIVGGLVFYQQASRAAEWQDVRRGIEAVNSEVRALYQVTKWQDQVGLWSDPDSSAGQYLNRTLITMGSVPPEMISSNGNWMILAHGGRFDVRHVADVVDPTQTNIMFTIHDVPEWLCTRLLPTRKTNPNASTGNGVVPAIRQIRIKGDSNQSDQLTTLVLRDPRPADPAQWIHGEITPAVAAQYCRERAEASSDRLVNIMIDTRNAL